MHHEPINMSSRITLSDEININLIAKKRSHRDKYVKKTAQIIKDIILNSKF